MKSAENQPPILLIVQYRACKRPEERHLVSVQCCRIRVGTEGKKCNKTQIRHEYEPRQDTAPREEEVYHEKERKEE